MIEARFNTKWLAIAVVFTAGVLVLSHLPQGTMPSALEKDGIDKLEHFLAYGVMTFLLLLSLRSSVTMRSALFLFLAISVIGAVDELTQLLVNRTASIADLAADIVGISAALFFFTVRRRRFLRLDPCKWSSDAKTP